MSLPEQRDPDASASTETADADHGASPSDASAELSTQRLLVAVAIASAAHLACSLGLLRLLVDAPTWTGRGVRASLVGVVLLTGVVALATTRFAERQGIRRVVQATPPVFGLVPALASLAVGVFWAFGSDAPSLELGLMRVVPLLAATTAPGLAIALPLEHALSTVAARMGTAEALVRRARGDKSSGSTHEISTPEAAPLAGRLGRLVAGLAVAICLLALAEVISQANNLDTWLSDSRTYLALLGTASVVITAVLAAASAGSSPGRDVQNLAERLNDIGTDAHDPQLSRIVSASALQPLDSIVRVTSFDAIGELFANLELLRAELAKNVASYQHALEKTHAVDTAKREFLAAVSHELRTPLNSILGFGQLLLESELTESQAEDVRLILAGGHQLRELIEDILDLSMIESGELELRFAACEPDKLVTDLVDIHRAQVREGVELCAEIHGPVPKLSCDRRRIGQVITNLLSNAIKFTEVGSVRVGLRFDQAENRLAMTVCDTGVGIEADQLEAIFEEYQQVGAPKRKIRGTGLGLAIAKRIAEAHGGKLSATSVLEEGSTFTLHLPLEPPNSRARTSSGDRS